MIERTCIQGSRKYHQHIPGYFHNNTPNRNPCVLIWSRRPGGRQEKDKEEEVEGLVHVSEMSWSQHLRTANDFLKVGDEVEAMVLTLDKEERKMSLGIKQLIPDPW